MAPEPRIQAISSMFLHSMHWVPHLGNQYKTIYIYSYRFGYHTYPYVLIDKPSERLAMHLLFGLRRMRLRKKSLQAIQRPGFLAPGS